MDHLFHSEPLMSIFMPHRYELKPVAVCEQVRMHSSIWKHVGQSGGEVKGQRLKSQGGLTCAMSGGWGRGGCFHTLLVNLCEKAGRNFDPRFERAAWRGGGATREATARRLKARRPVLRLTSAGRPSLWHHHGSSQASPLPGIKGLVSIREESRVTPAGWRPGGGGGGGGDI